MLRFTSNIYLLFFVLIVGSGCTTYRDKIRTCERALVTEKYDVAKKKLQENKFLSKKRNALLFNLEMGKVCHLLGEFEQSNTYFNKADLLMEQFRNSLDMLVGITINPALQNYIAEPHEQIMIHYYKILNYLQLGNQEDVLVELRRLELKEKALKIAANGNEKKYSEDAFGLFLMGMIYESVNDQNNAYIAYRNAKLVYQSDQTGIYKGNQPITLEQDILRNANRTGIAYESVEKYNSDYGKNGELVLFYESGLSPVKSEHNYYFLLKENSAGFYFQADDLIVPVEYNFREKNARFNPADIGIIRLSVPHYINRSFTFNEVVVNVNGDKKNMQLVEDISSISFQIEKDNFIKNLARDLLRLTLKKIAELAVRQKYDYAAAALGIANALTEKADTRNWQSLPSRILFLRIPLQEGTNKISISTLSEEEYSFEVTGNAKMTFRNFCDYQ